MMQARNLRPEILPEDESGYIGRIPVRNLWLLMLYASELFRVSGSRSLSLDAGPDEIPDLIATILTNAVEKRLRRSLSPGYNLQEDWLNRVRGRINMISTERHQLLKRGLIACSFEELSADTSRNRFVRAALESISRIVKRKELSHKCRSLSSTLRTAGVSGNPPGLMQMNNERFGRHDMIDQQMVAAAKLAFQLLMPTEKSGKVSLPNPEREITWARQLFERAIGGFYESVLGSDGWAVKRGSRQYWQIDEQTSGIHDIFPEMRTDIVLDDLSKNRRIVIDTKFNSILSKGWYRNESLRSGYIYQIYSYLRSQVGSGDPLAESASGLLLHPSIAETVDESATIQGHQVRFATIDLTGDWKDFHTRLLEFCDISPSKLRK